ncbi:hypothetical protein [Argonema galeatum]|uniref:hypothetical protein n=1 Tax=Argonema galeatum TaxID=2942762 RepID=UPI00201175E6|nr:hypothetical protein [Argonema galeatum]MCL1464802.1 hypothetical protein [Argonema galeatum A003/A1]
MSCNQLYCPWVQDSRDPDHYVCLKCDRERYINQSNNLSMLLIVVAIALILALLVGCAGKQETSPIESPNHSSSVKF